MAVVLMLTKWSHAYSNSEYSSCGCPEM